MSPDSIVGNLRDCRRFSDETVELCSSTLRTGQSLVDCGSAIQKSLAGAATDLTAESFSVIADLTDGDKAKEAQALAVQVTGMSGKCVELSLKMISSLQASVAALPDVIEDYVEKKAEQSIANELAPEERDMISLSVEENEAEIDACIDAIDELRLLTAVDAGSRAFSAVESKSRLCNSMFHLIQKFATDVRAIMIAIENADARTILGKIKDGTILRAIGLAKHVKDLASACKRMMDKVVKLFKSATEKLTVLWRALSHAKGVIFESLKEFLDAQSLCGEANAKLMQLKRIMSRIGGLEAVKKQLSGDSDSTRSIDDSLDIARGVDSKLEKISSKMTGISTRVENEYKLLPSIIVDGVGAEMNDDMAGSLASLTDQIESDIASLDAATASLEKSHIISAVATTHQEITVLPKKMETCEQAMNSCNEVMDRSKAAAELFLGRWTLETSVSNINEMKKLVSLSELMRQVTDQLRVLLKKIVLLLRTIVCKGKDMAGQIGGDGLASAAADLVSGGIMKVFG